MTRIRTILAVLSDEVSGEGLLETTFQAGAIVKAHVEVLHVRINPVNAVPVVGEGMSGALVEEMVDMAERESKRRAEQVRVLFDEACARHGLKPTETKPRARGASLHWSEIEGREEDVVITRGRVSDLIVVGQPSSERELPSMLTLNTALHETGRAVLVAPPRPSKSLGKSAVIAWNGSTEAARAVAGAIPLLAATEQVTALVIGETADSEVSGKSLVDYLAWHGVRCDLHHLELCSGRDVGGILIKQCAERKADYLVMGAYTQNRLQRLIYGGATRYVLDNAEIPVFLAH